MGTPAANPNGPPPTRVRPPDEASRATNPPLVTQEHEAALDEARRLAAFTGRSPTSVDVLLGLLRTAGAAGHLLRERGVSSARLEPHLDRVVAPGGRRPRDELKDVAAASVELARQLAPGPISSLHLLLATARTGTSAVELLHLAGFEAARLRAIVVRALTGPRPHGERALPAPTPAAPTPVGEPVAPPEPAALPAPSTPPPELRNEVELVAVEPPSTPVLHRTREVDRLLDLLRTAAPRLICVVGEPGVGKSAVIAAAAAVATPAPIAPAPGVAAVGGPGLLAIHRAAELDAPLVLDGGVGALLGPEGGDGPATLLQTARAGRRWVLTATPADIRRWELSAPDLAARLDIVRLEPLRGDALLEAVETGLDRIAQTHGLVFTPASAALLLRLAGRYPSEQVQPGRALAIAELAAARTQRLASGTTVDEATLCAVIADAAGVPASSLARTDDERFAGLDARLAERVVGHEEARTRIADALRRSYAGFRGGRPLASVLLLGPTGVGKTETARAIADALFDGDASLVRIDMSEYSEPHTVARLIGSPPGYIGHEDGGQLTEAVRRRPAAVVLLDELEKAHREVLLLLLQVLEDGRLTDGRGRTVDFANAAVVMTSNLGSELYRRARPPASAAVLAAARAQLPAELWNRIDEVLCYAPLDEPALRQIVRRLALASSLRLQHERGIGFTIDEAVVSAILASETDRSLGARPLRRAFERLVEGPLATRIIAGELRPGDRPHLTWGAGALTMGEQPTTTVPAPARRRTQARAKAR